MLSLLAIIWNGGGEARWAGRAAADAGCSVAMSLDLAVARCCRETGCLRDEMGNGEEELHSRMDLGARGAVRDLRQTAHYARWSTSVCEE